MNDLITAQGYFLYDGEHHLGIYIPSGHDKELGDEVAVTGVLDTRGEYENVAIVDLDDADLYFMVYHQSLADSIADLEDNLGKVVEITVIYYTNHSRDGVLVVYQNEIGNFNYLD